MKLNNSFLIISLTLLLIQCKSNTDVTKEALPYIGKHDIATVTTDEWSAGDTIYHKVPHFAYLNQFDDTLSSEQIAGKIWVVKFFFTTCPTICPPMTSAMMTVADSLSGLNNEVVYLSFSIDPRKDSTARLREYIKDYEIKHEHWYFLTGDEEATHDLGVNGFYIHAQSDDLAPGGFAHSPNFILVDQNQHIRGLYNGLLEEERIELINDVRRLAKNK